MYPQRDDILSSAITLHFGNKLRLYGLGEHTSVILHDERRFGSAVSVIKKATSWMLQTWPEGDGTKILCVI